DREQRAFSELLAVCRRLRGPGGCPWDRQQTLETMTPYLTEEAVESGEAIASGDDEHIAEELGDLAFLSIFCLELLAERGKLGLADALEKAGAVGFDWPEAAGALAKVHEELSEVERVIDQVGAARAREIGDLLFATVNLSRHLAIDPERELRSTIHRFRDRFHHIERRLAEGGRTPSQATLEELDALWEEAKAALASP